VQENDSIRRLNKIDVTPPNGRFGVYVATQTNHEDTGTRAHFFYTVLSRIFSKDEIQRGEMEVEVLGNCHISAFRCVCNDNDG